MVDTSIEVTDKLLDDLLDDWFERDGETFLKIRKTRRVGWEKTLEEGESYSAYLLEAPTQEDLIKRAYSLAKETITVMDPPFKFRVKISKGTASYTDSKVVCVSTMMFDEPELSVGEKLDTFLGTAIHEGCHLCWTNFKEGGKIGHKVVHSIFNVIEDERIEEICGEQKPGLANFLEKSKYYYFDQYYLDYVVPKEREEKLTPFDRLFNLLLHIVRYPKYLKESEVEEFAPYLVEIKKILVPYPITTADTVKAAYKIYDIIKEFYEHDERERLEAEGKSASDSDVREAAEKRLSKDAEDAEEAIKKVAGSSASGPSEDGGGLGDSDLASAVRADDGLLGELCEGTVEVGTGDDTFFSKAQDKQTVYMESLSRVRRYIPSIAKIMKGHCKSYKLIHRSMRSGVLDTNKLAEAIQGVPTVYVREGEVKTDKASVCVVIDESGSMHGTRIQAARDTAVLINEAIGNIPQVELFIYGHSGDMKRYHSTEMYVYREKDYKPKFSLGSCEARSENRDGVAIEEIARRVRKQTKNPVLMFILSDGAPAAGGYYGSAAMDHVKHCVEKVEHMGFNVIQVCINHSYDPGLMFKHYVVLEDMSTLAFELGKAIKKATMTACRVSVT